jgi:uncharacterized protein YdhG (YjbR/CyaY superfamily)
MPPKPATIDEYMMGFPPEIQALLEQVRATIQRAAPEAHEVISYGMPAFKQHGYLVFFAGFKAHIGMYGNTTAALEAYKDELVGFVGPKGSLKFPYKRPIPLDLIGRIVQIRVQEDIAHAAAMVKKGADA